MKAWFELFSRIIGLALFAIGSWHGIVDNLYPQACFEILLAYGMRID